MYVSEYTASRRRARFGGRLSGVPLINQGGGAYNTPTASKPSGGDITANPLVYSNPYTGAIAGGVQILKKIGVHIDLKSPSAHIKERLARAVPLKAAALAGDDRAWAQLWQASGRDLPVRAVAAVPEGSSKTVGWPRVKPQLTAMLLEIEAARGTPSPGNTTQAQPSGAFPTSPAQVMNMVGGVPVLATVGFLALAFILKDR